MTIAEIEELIRKYLSTGIAVVVVLVAPGTRIDDTTLPPGSQVVTVEPTRPDPTPSTRPTPAPSSSGTDSGSGDRTGAGGSDPGADTPPSSGSGSGSGSDQQPGATNGSGSEPDSGSTPGSDSSGAASGSGSGSGSGSDSSSGSGSDSGTGGGSGSDSATGSGADSGGSGSGPGTGGGSGSHSNPGSDAGSDSDSDSSGSGSDSASGSDASSNSGTASGSGTESGTASGSGSNGGSGSAGNSAGAGSGQGSGSSSSSSDGTTAAATLGWGTPHREDDFSSGAGQWSIYDGAGHGGQGKRSPSAVSITGGVMTVTGDSSGTTAGMAWNPGQKYGRWEGRVKAPASDPSYNALLLLWPDAENWPSGGEVDFMEMSDPSRQETSMFLHYGADNQQLNGKVQVDATQWHNWAVEWTPDAITAYVDGKEWYRTTDKSTFPPGPMHLCIQLDWFPQGGGAKESTMQVDWVRQYPVDGSSGSNSGAGSSGGGSGQQSSQQSGNDSDGSKGADQTSGVRNILRRMFSWG